MRLSDKRHSSLSLYSEVSITTVYLPLSAGRIRMLLSLFKEDMALYSAGLRFDSGECLRDNVLMIIERSGIAEAKLMPGPRWVGIINMGVARTARLRANACKPTWFAQILSSGAFPLVISQ